MNKKEEILSSYHKSLTETIRSREVELNKFIGIIIPALAVFFLGVWKYFELKNDSGQELLLLGGYLAGVLLCSWGMLLALKLGYTHRSIQMVMSRLEKDIYLIEYLPSFWKGKNWERTVEKGFIKRVWRYINIGKLMKEINEFLPEVYQLHFYMFVWCILFMSTGIAVLIFSAEASTIKCKAIAVIVLFILVIFWVWKVHANINTYYEKLRKQKEELEI